MSKTNRKHNEYKIVIAGLDNAGKTSSLIALRQKYNFYEKVKNLKPTIKVDYSSFKFLVNTFFFWDMGGQEKYREIYVKDPVYFSETDYLYFIIDIQDELKFEEASNYLHTILDIYRLLDYSNEVIICFDKYDPKYKIDKDFIDRAEMLKTLILKQNNDMNFKFFNMSYFDIASISKAFSYSLNKFLKLEKLNDKMQKLVEDFNCKHAILYTDTGLIISDYYKEIMDSREFNEIISINISNNLEFFQRLVDENVEIDERLNIDQDTAEYVKKYSLNINSDLYSLYLGISTQAEKINAIKKVLKEIQNEIENCFH
ncbi:MAG: ADP-ribosylation factor-like protein [Candidatus Thorarchaeota archaeon]